MDYFFAAASAEHQKKEKAKARELRISQWWKQELGKGLCYHCGNRFKPAELTMDHLIPIARGGKSTKNNCVTSCKDCNSKKGYKTRAEMALEELKNSSSFEDTDTAAEIPTSEVVESHESEIQDSDLRVSEDCDLIKSTSED